MEDIYFMFMKVCDPRYTLNNIGSLEGTLQYYYYATPVEPLQDSPGVA